MIFIVKSFQTKTKEKVEIVTSMFENLDWNLILSTRVHIELTWSTKILKLKRKDVQMKIEMSCVKFANVKILIICFFQFCDNVFETRS